MSRHKFSPERAKHLDNPLRRVFLKPDKLFNLVGVAGKEIWADIGAGTGYFAIPLARRVKKVYALDISSQMLDLLQQRVIKNSIGDIQALLSNESSFPLEDDSVDGILLAFVAHELETPADALRDTERILRPGGRLIIVEYAKVLSFGPPLKERLEQKQIDKWTYEAGFKKGRTWHLSRSIVAWEYVKDYTIGAAVRL